MSSSAKSMFMDTLLPGTGGGGEDPDDNRRKAVKHSHDEAPDRSLAAEENEDEEKGERRPRKQPKRRSELEKLSSSSLDTSDIQYEPKSGRAMRRSSMMKNSTIARDLRTRQGTATQAAMGGGPLLPQRVPPTTCGGQRVWNRAGRPSIPQDVADQYWRNNATAICVRRDCLAVSEGVATGTAFVADDARWRRSIDHVTPWVSLRAALAWHDMCDGTWHWRVYLSADVTRDHDDPTNFQPMHQACNSSKSGGGASTDNIGPVCRGACPGGCGLQGP